MALMKKIRNYTVGIVLLSGAVVAAYELLLTDEAKQNLSKSVAEMRKSVQDLSDAVHDARGVTVDEENYLANREDTLKQWEAIGF